MASTLAFWFDPASTYAYLTAMRIETLAQRAGVEVAWRPFLLGPIFRDQGWTSSPFNIYPAKGRYMVRDIARIAADRGLEPFVLPQPFPANSLMAARIAVALSRMPEGWAPDAALPAFVKAASRAAFAQGQDIGDEHVLARVLTSLGHDAHAVLAIARTEAVKAQLRANTEEAQAAGVFGAPSFTSTDGELFWGDDRLEQAIAWAASRA